MKITVIDFETATGKLYSACAVGITVIENGAITDSVHYLIQPPFNHYYPRNIQVHGIQPSDTADCDTFPAVWEQIKHYFADTYVAAHSASFDMSVLKTTLKYYKIKQPHFVYFDTLKLARVHFGDLDKLTLDALCEKYNIPLEHHNAASDASATAELILQTCHAFEGIDDFFNSLDLLNYGSIPFKELTEKDYVVPSENGSSKSIYRDFSSMKHKRAHEIAATTNLDEETDGDFLGKTFVFTGEMVSISREDAMTEVVKRGGFVKDGITKKTSVLVNANDDGVLTGKVKKAMELQALGFPIKIINEKIFALMLADYGTIDIDSVK